MTWRGRILRLWRDSAGSSLLEYSVLITIISAVIVIGVGIASVWISEKWMDLFSAISP
jgi:Flp pilus assembly pilin Flp